ncbi:hypothetical protein [Pannonibacter indicus]|uniref:hypothetical protein n=1 Tax=Pannonibacter indicus TaxID=466044 RepID=UPI0035B07B2E
MESDIQESIKHLKKSPIHFASLAGFELFHRNILYYILNNNKKNPQIITSIIQECQDELKINEVLKEKNHFDILIKAESPEGAVNIILEIKAKTLPDKNQLEKYNKTIESKYRERKNYKIYITLYNTKILEEIHLDKFLESNGWKSIDLIGMHKLIEDYSDINNEAYKNSFADYKTTLQHQCNVINSILKHPNEIKKIKEIELNSICEKILAAKACAEIMNNIKPHNSNVNNISTENINFNVIHTRGRIGMELFINKPHERKSIRAGVQIQGDAVNVFFDHGDDFSVNYAENFIDKYIKEIKLLGENINFTKNKKSKYRYRPNFFYRKFKLPNNMTALDVINQINKDAKDCSEEIQRIISDLAEIMDG